MLRVLPVLQAPSCQALLENQQLLQALAEFRIPVAFWQLECSDCIPSLDIMKQQVAGGLGSQQEQHQQQQWQQLLLLRHQVVLVKSPQQPQEELCSGITHKCRST